MDQTTSDLVKSIVAGQVRHLCTWAAGALVTYGVVAPSDSSQVITVLSGICIGLIGQGWSWWQKSDHAALIAKIKGEAEFWKSKKGPVPAQAPKVAS